MLKLTSPIEDNHRHFHVAAAPASAGLTRRKVLTAAAASLGAGLACTGSLVQAQQPGLRSRNEQVLGPFYPVRLPADQDADLTLIAGKDGRALGQLVYLGGRVTNLRGEPVAGAELELWQANAVGRYTPPLRPEPVAGRPQLRGLRQDPHRS